MEIPGSVLEGLCSLGALEMTQFAALVDGVYDVLSNKTSTQSLLDKSRVEGKESIVDSLMLFVSEACKRNVSTSTIKEVLEDLQVPADKVSRFIASHKVKQLTLKSILAGTKPCHASILDVRWKLEYCKGEGPRYSIQLLTDRDRDRDRGTPLQFYCSPAQLSDLVSQLQTATFSIDKFISSQTG